MKRYVILALLVSSILLTGCIKIENESLILERYELKNEEVIPISLSFNYTASFPDKIEPTSFYIQFITGKYIDIRKETYGDAITSDVIYNVSSYVNETYFLHTKGVYSGQEVGIVEAVISSKDGSLNKDVKSDFILIRR